MEDGILQCYNSDSSEYGSSLSQSSTETSLYSNPLSDKHLCKTGKLLCLPPSFEDPQRQYPPLPKPFPPLPPSETPTTIAEADLQTPDKWVKRNSELLRLTGKHPFNCEAPLKRLFEMGFLTLSHLHFVRNHGAVPQVDEAKFHDWRIRIHGLVENEHEFSLRELKETFQIVTLPVTLVCAGNRRKEQNLVRKSLGFNWGAAGLSTALWTGVYLADVLDYIKPIRPKGKHIIFEGSDNLPNGPYGTSQKLSWAMDRGKGMMIAWAMNGLPLEPDHGFPVRIIVPGQIGGRSMKWLNQIEVSAEESQHYLHFFDNKVLPMQLTPEQARAEKHWWYDPKYLITELNVNSAIAQPNYGDVLDLDPPTSRDKYQTFTICGYAYAGGGRRINRVELSFDDGETWSLAELEHPEDLYREMSYMDSDYGTLDLTARDTCFCWCFWSFSILIAKLKEAASISVRAMDEGMNIQPRDMYLNATSMLNNCWFRIAISNTETGLRFEHPTLASEPGGWMERMKAAGQDIMRPIFKPSPDAPASKEDATVSPPQVPLTNPEVTKRMAPAEFEAQSRDRPWFVVQGEIYDGTAYLTEHPGGADSIAMMSGDDATEDFLSIHSVDAKMKLREFHIGTLSGPLKKTQGDNDNVAPSSVFLHPKVWKTAKLATITRINHDSCLFRFSLPDSEQLLGLPTGQHVFMRVKRKDTGEMVQRAFTPVSKQSVVGHIDFLIKLYLPCSAFPEGGKMSAALDRLDVGDPVEIKGPMGSFIWQGCCRATWKGVERAPKQVGMICGGTGITPILQVLREILHYSKEHDIQTWLLYANKTEADILCREELHDLLVAYGEDRFRLHHILGTVPESWAYSKGRITDDILRKHLPPPSTENLVLICGPNAMVTDTVTPGLIRCGWDVERCLVVL